MSAKRDLSSISHTEDQVEAAVDSKHQKSSLDTLCSLYKLGFDEASIAALDFARNFLNISDFGIKLVGPSEVLEQPKKFEDLQTGQLHLFHRYPLHSPEVQTIALSEEDSDSCQYCLFRDAPGDVPVSVVSINASGVVAPCGDTLFAFLHHMAKKKKQGDAVAKIKDEANKYNASLKLTSAWKKRKSLISGETINRQGISVPVNDQGIGYRPLSISLRELRQLISSIEQEHESDDNKQAAMSELDNLIQLSNIANDEMDFGQALELGISLWTSSKLLTREAVNLLEPTYELLQRNVFAEIVRKHSKSRNTIASKIEEL